MIHSSLACRWSARWMRFWGFRMTSPWRCLVMCRRLRSRWSWTSKFCTSDGCTISASMLGDGARTVPTVDGNAALRICSRNRFVLDSMTCAQTCALDCEWHMIVDFKICCFHVVSLSPQKVTNLQCWASRTLQLEKAGRVELARFLWSCSFAWNSNGICQDWGIIVDRWAREEDQRFLGAFREGACFDSPHRGAPSRAEGLGTFQCRFLPWVSPVVFISHLYWRRCLCLHEEWGRRHVCS